MRITDKTNNLIFNQKHEKELRILFSKLENESFADEFQFGFKNFGRHFYYQFLKNEKYSNKYYLHEKKLSSFVKEFDEQ